MATYYELWLTNDVGERLGLIKDPISLNCSQITNGIGSFGMVLPTSVYNQLGLDPRIPDRMLQVWRKPDGGSLKLWRPYFIRKFLYGVQGNRNQVYIEGPDCNDTLRRRIIAAFSETEYSLKSDYADDMMKEYVTQALLDNIPPTPDAGTRTFNNFSIEPDASRGPSITKGLAFKKLLTPSGGGALPIISEISKIAGNQVFFNVEVDNVTSSSISFVFRTKIDQPGRDRTEELIPFSLANGNLENPSLEFDYTEEENYIYSLGRAEGEAREIQQVYDSVRYGKSTWNRCEGAYNASGLDEEENAVLNAGRAQLHRGRPIIRYSATPVDTSTSRFGVEWGFGDKVPSKFRGYEFNSIIWAAVINLTEGKESIRTKLEYEGAI